MIVCFMPGTFLLQNKWSPRHGLIEASLLTSKEPEFLPTYLMQNPQRLMRAFSTDTSVVWTRVKVALIHYLSPDENIQAFL